jgi:hypothetical protein
MRGGPVPPDQPVPVPDEAFVALEALREALAPFLRQGFGLGVGLKETAGEITDRIALVVYLPQKLPFDEVPDGAMIPTEFLGFQTDVVERDWRIAEDTTFHSPVVGGSRWGIPLSSHIPTARWRAWRVSAPWERWCVAARRVRSWG